MIGEALEQAVPGLVSGKPEEHWFRRLLKLLFEITSVLVAGQHAKMVLPPSAEQSIDSAGSPIEANAVTIRLSATGTITVTAAPTIADGEDGQLICLTNVGSSDIVIQDQGTLADSNLRLAAATVTLTPRDSLWLRFDQGTGDGDWLQVTPLVGVV